jgi:uncharacterized protein
MSKPRGFAALSPEKRHEISSKGGKAAHAAGTAHEYTSEEARASGRLGGKASHKKKVAARDAGANAIVERFLAPTTLPSDPPEVPVEDQVIDSAAGCPECPHELQLGVDPTPSAVKADETQRVYDEAMARS